PPLPGLQAHGDPPLPPRRWPGARVRLPRRAQRPRPLRADPTPRGDRARPLLVEVPGRDSRRPGARRRGDRASPRRPAGGARGMTPPRPGRRLRTPQAAGVAARAAGLAAEQWGVVSLGEPRAWGLNRTAVMVRARNGLLHRLHAQVYAVGHANPPLEGRF